MLDSGLLGRWIDPNTGQSSFLKFKQFYSPQFACLGIHRAPQMGANIVVGTSSLTKPYCRGMTLPLPSVFVWISSKV